MSYKDSVKAYNQWYAKLNAEKIAKRKREWYLSHKNEVREYYRQWWAKRKADRYANQSVTEGKGDENAN